MVAILANERPSNHEDEIDFRVHGIAIVGYAQWYPPKVYLHFLT